jgi:cytochrome c5
VPQVGPAPVVAPEPDRPATPAGALSGTPAAAKAPPPQMATEFVAAVQPAKPTVSEAAPATPKPDLAHGQQIYRQTCAFCHDKGVAGAPKTGDAGAWSPRVAQGIDTLYASALHGKGAMPAKGGNPSLMDADVKAAVDYLTAQAR